MEERISVVGVDEQMVTKNELKKQLAELGIDPYGTVLVHSSYKSIGEVKGGPDTVLDALSEYMRDGLVVLPTHTWNTINEDSPYFYVKETPSHVGILTELFRQRKETVRSWHPTHSVAALGIDAKEYIKGQEKVETPCARESVYGKLLDRRGQIMLIGVDLRRNTFIHGIEEWMDIPGRVSDTYQELFTILEDGTEIPVPSRRHIGLRWSEHFWKVDEVLQETGAMRIGKFGKAEVRVCDAERLTDVLSQMLEAEPELFSDNKPLSAEMRNFFQKE